MPTDASQKQPSEIVASKPLSPAVHAEAHRTARYVVDLGTTQILLPPYAAELATAYLQLTAERDALRDAAAAGDAAVETFRASLVAHFERASAQPPVNLGQQWHAHELNRLADFIRNFQPQKD